MRVGLVAPQAPFSPLSLETRSVTVYPCLRSKFGVSEKKNPAVSVRVDIIGRKALVGRRA